MKHIFLSILLSLCCFYGYSDSRGIEISNQSRCDLYLQIRGSKDCGTCAKQYFSDLIVIPGGAIVTFANTSFLGGNFPAIPAYIHSVLLYSGPRHCRLVQTWQIGEARCNFPTELAFFAQDGNCRVACERLRAQWLASENSRCEGIARLLVSY